MSVLDLVRATANALPSDHRITITVQWHPEVSMVLGADLNPAYVPPQELLATAADLQGVPVDVPPPPPPISDPDRMIVNTPKLNVRSTPSTAKPAINVLVAGQVVEVRGSTKVGTNTWAELVSIDGLSATGYVAREFLKPAPAPTPVPPPIPPTPQVGAWGDHFLGAQTVPSNYAHAIAKAVDQPGILIALHNQNPTGTFIYRHYLDFAEQDRRLRLMQSDMDGALNQYMAEMEPHFARMPWALFESLNEVDGPPQYLEFERRRAEAMGKRGLRPLVLNISVARATQGMLTDAAPMITAATEAQGAVGFHCYGMGILSNNAGNSYVRADGSWQGDLFPTITPGDWDNCHTGLSILKYRGWLNKQGQGKARLIATELGLGNTADPDHGRPGLLNTITKGWRDCIPLWQRMGWLNGTTAPDFYRKQLDWWVAQTGCDGAVYTRGTGGDHEWDVDDTTGAL